ncbi:hypothetical protein [Tunturiibacter gelidiferens]|uniref:Uncharacterized protein n=1 Tax=Tunturiibacter gelidiferens TaxID=3069689 RepID=A0AAU7YWC6_9BACT
MTSALAQVEQPSGERPLTLTEAQTILSQLVLGSVLSIQSKRIHTNALDDLFAFVMSSALSHALLMDYRTTMDHLRPPRPSMSGCRPFESWSVKPVATA